MSGSWTSYHKVRLCIGGLKCMLYQSLGVCLWFGLFRTSYSSCLFICEAYCALIVDALRVCFNICRLFSLYVDLHSVLSVKILTNGFLSFCQKVILSALFGNESVAVMKYHGIQSFDSHPFWLVNFIHFWKSRPCTV